MTEKLKKLSINQIEEILRLMKEYEDFGVMYQHYTNKLAYLVKEKEVMEGLKEGLKND